MKKGFTLIELVLVITILGILAVSALPNFINLSTQTEQASRDGVIGAVNAGIALHRSNNLVTSGSPGIYPQVLDTVAAGTACSSATPCFAGVLMQGVSEGNWTKMNDTTYVFNDGANSFTYNYDAATGKFSLPAAR